MSLNIIQQTFIGIFGHRNRAKKFILSVGRQQSYMWSLNKWRAMMPKQKRAINYVVSYMVYNYKVKG